MQCDFCKKEILVEDYFKTEQGWKRGIRTPIMDIKVYKYHFGIIETRSRQRVEVKIACDNYDCQEELYTIWVGVDE